jgi:hypothetical protein
MGELIVRDDGQLSRVERAIQTFAARSLCDQMRMQSLLLALQAEREMLLTTRRPRKPKVKHRLPGHPALLNSGYASQAATSSQVL